MFHEYEIVFIIRPDLDDAEVIAAIERVEATVTETGGHVLERDDWGKRKLAYIVKKHTKGHYVLLSVAVDPSTILEIERRMRLDDRVIRFLTANIAEDVDVEVRLKEAEESRKRREEEIARRRAAGELDDDRDDRTEEDEDDAAEG